MVSSSVQWESWSIFFLFLYFIFIQILWKYQVVRLDNTHDLSWGDLNCTGNFWRNGSSSLVSLHIPRLHKTFYVSRSLFSIWCRFLSPPLDHINTTIQLVENSIQLTLIVLFTSEIINPQRNILSSNNCATPIRYMAKLVNYKINIDVILLPWIMLLVPINIGCTCCVKNWTIIILRSVQIIFQAECRWYKCGYYTNE